MSFQPSKPSWNNHVYPTYGAGGFGGSTQKYQAKKKKVEKTDETEFSTINDEITDLDIDEQNKSLIQNIKDFLISIYKKFIQKIGLSNNKTSTEE